LHQIAVLFSHVVSFVTEIRVNHHKHHSTSAVPACALQSTAALPFGTIVIIMLIWSAITIPLTVFGGIAGKNHQVPLQPHVTCSLVITSPHGLLRLPKLSGSASAHLLHPSLPRVYCRVCRLPALQGDFAAPVRTNKYPREIPELPWYRTAVPQMLMAGALKCLRQHKRSSICPVGGDH
jgi:Endomembrane protein 70